MLRILSKKGQPKLLLFGYHAYVAVALVTADHPIVLTDETFVSSSQITSVLSVICASLYLSLLIRLQPYDNALSKLLYCS